MQTPHPAAWVPKFFDPAPDLAAAVQMQFVLGFPTNPPKGPGALFNVQWCVQSKTYHPSLKLPKGGGVPPFRELFSGSFRAHVNIPEMDEEKYRKGRGEVFLGISCCPMLSMSEHYTCVVACDFRIERAQGVVQSACP